MDKATIKLKQQLLNFVPFDEEEAVNIRVFLQFIDGFQEHIWTRDNTVGHVTVSAWVTNPLKDKVLMAHHNIYNSFAWLGGHADGEYDLLKVAQKEVREETGVFQLRPIKTDFVDVCSMIVKPHIKNNHPVASHLHFNLTYWLEADEKAILQNAPAENSAVCWLPIDRLFDFISEEHMKPVYQRLIQKMYK